MKIESLKASELFTSEEDSQCLHPYGQEGVLIHPDLCVILADPVHRGRSRLVGDGG